MNHKRPCLEKFRRWIDQFKILNPLESNSVLKYCRYNEYGDILWIDFKDPEFSFCITQPEYIAQPIDYRNDIFEFYFAVPNTGVKIKNCRFNESKTCIASSLDIVYLRFLETIGMIKIQIGIFPCVDVKFTLEEKSIIKLNIEPVTESLSKINQLQTGELTNGTV